MKEFLKRYWRTVCTSCGSLCGFAGFFTVLAGGHEKSLTLLAVGAGLAILSLTLIGTVVLSWYVTERKKHKRAGGF